MKCAFLLMHFDGYKYVQNIYLPIYYKICILKWLYMWSVFIL